MRRLAIALLAVGLFAAGCSHEDAPPPDAEAPANDATPAPAPEQPSPPPPEPRAAMPREVPPVESNSDAAIDTPPDVSMQTQDDADATGMTTRASPSAAEEGGQEDGNGPMTNDSAR